MRWNLDGWPAVGVARDGNECGEPVLSHRKPALRVPRRRAWALPMSDKFTRATLGPQWQWEGALAQEAHSFGSARTGLRLHALPARDLWNASHVLTQRVVGPRSTVTSRLSLVSEIAGTRAGLIVMGRDYAWIGLRRTADGIRVTRGTCRRADVGPVVEEEEIGPRAPAGRACFRVEMAEHVPWSFSYSLDAGATWHLLGIPFTARAGIWVGARVGLFALANEGSSDAGHANVAWWRVTS
jgi:beta-xylosidase